MLLASLLLELDVPVSVVVVEVESPGSLVVEVVEVEVDVELDVEVVVSTWPLSLAPELEEPRSASVVPPIVVPALEPSLSRAPALLTTNHGLSRLHPTSVSTNKPCPTQRTSPSLAPPGVAAQ